MATQAILITAISYYAAKTTSSIQLQSKFIVSRIKEAFLQPLWQDILQLSAMNPDNYTLGGAHVHIIRPSAMNPDNYTQWRPCAHRQTM